MVFESVIVDILNKYLKPYVKRLDSSQLNLGVWKGHVRVEKLELKEDLFAEAHLDVPVRIKRSYVGNLEMQIPWKSLGKDPIVATIDEVYIILGPDLDTKYDADRDKQRLRKGKAKKIKEYHDALKKKKQKEKEAKKSKKKKKKETDKPDTFAEKLAVHMTKNLQVTVRDIHVRYEDDVTNPNSMVAAGITLHSLVLKSTDGNWVPCVVRETATLIYKLVELNCLGIYWNTSCESSLASPDLTMEKMIDEMRRLIARPALAPPPTNSYLLNPMSASARLKLNLKPGVDLSLPQLLVGVECEDIVFSLQQIQLKTLLVTVESYDRHVVNQKYLKYKPSVPVKGNHEDWWRYAVTAVLEEDVKRRTQMWSWKHIKQHRERVKLYLEKYREKLHSINPSSTLLDQIQTLEDDLDWFNILVYREEAAKKEKSKPKKEISSSPRPSISKPPTTPTTSPPSLSPPTTPQHPQPSPDGTRRTVESSSQARKNSGRRKSSTKEKKEGGFFSKLKLKMKQPGRRPSAIKEGAEGASAEEFVVVDSSKQVSERTGAAAPKAEVIKEERKTSAVSIHLSEEEEQKDRQELYNAIGYSPDEEFVEYPKEYVAHEVHVLVNTFTLELCGKKQKLGNLVTKNIKVDVLNRPSSESVSVKASVSSLEMSGISKGNQTTTMITSNVGGSLKSEEPLVDFQLELKPIDRPGMDVTVRTVLRPLQIIYDFDTVNGLIEMFKPPNLIRFQELTNAASASWEQLKSQTTAGLQDALKNRKQIDIDVTLHSPYLLVPESGNFSDESCLIVVDLGQLRVFGSTKNPQSLPKVVPSKDDLSLFYDKFSVKLEGMQVLVARPGEDWKSAMANVTSPLHIVDPTGFEIQLLKSIVTDDALLASMRVEGTLAGFEVKLSDVALASLIKVASTLEKPPAMITTTDEYNELPSRPPPKMLLDSASKLAEFDAISLSSMSVSSFGDDDDDESLADEEETCVLSPTAALTNIGEEMGDKDISRNVFTDVSIKLIVNEVSVKLTQTSQPTTTTSLSRKKSSLSPSQTPLLDIVISDIRADIVDRKWDTQGSVAMREVMVVDHITKDPSGQPTYLLKTECLNDGNFISARFVSITKVGVDFAAKYTGLEDSLSAQLSLVKLKLHRSTIKTLLQYAMALKPSVDNPSLSEEKENQFLGPGGLEPISELETAATTINPKDFEADVKPKGKEFQFDVQFEGIDVSLAQDDSDFLYAGLTGFLIKGTARPSTITVVASIKDLIVKDPSLSTSGTTIISKADVDKNFVLLNVVQYNLKSHEREPHDLSWVDTSLKAEVNRINVNLDTTFLANVLEFVKKLDIDQSAFQSAAKATAETATVTATAIIESARSAHRLKLDVTLHAPVIELPFYTKNREGNIYIDLGEFQISNRLKHGHDVHHGSFDSDCSYETMTVFGAQTLLDCMEIRTTSIQIFRKSHPVASECSLIDPSKIVSDESHSIILEPLQFTATVTRNISMPTRAFPNVDIRLALDTIKLHIHEEDIQALIMIGLAASRITEVMATPPKEEIPTRPRFTTTFSRPKGGTVSGSPASRQRSRTRAGSRLRKFHTYEEVTDVRLEATLDTVTLDLTTNDGPLFKAGASGIGAKVDVLKNKVLVSASVHGLSVVDLATGDGYNKVVSIAEETATVSSVLITVYTEEGRNPLSPLGKIQANIAQLQLFIPIPFVLRAVDFIMRLDINKSMLATATKTAQDGASAVTAAAQDKYFKVDVKVHAPVLLVPTSQQSKHGIMIDLGSLAVQNTLLIPDKSANNIGIDAYGITLNAFKISRVLLDPKIETGTPVTAERTLLQPFNFLLAVERNLCPWYTSIPTININLNMEEIKIFLGQEDLEQFFSFGLSVGDRVSYLFEKGQPTDESSPVSPIDSVEAPGIDAATADSEGSPDTPMPDSEVEAFEFLRVLWSLTGFEVKLFKDEPKLSPDNESSKSLSKFDDFALTSLQLVAMEATVKMTSNNEVEVQATMKDIALSDIQKGRQDRNTGNRVVQHYTNNPLKAYTGKIDRPLLSVRYILRDDQHIIFFSAEKLLILSDIEFMKVMADYFKAIFSPDPKSNKQVNTVDKTNELEDTLRTTDESSPPKLTKQDTLTTSKKRDKKKQTKLPKLKVNLSIKDFRVAIIENVDTPHPQALTLKLSTHVHAQLSESTKQVSLNVADLGIATSSFFDLDNTTSWVLLPCSISVSMDGPIDTPAMSVHGIVEPISLTLSPAVVRLIIHAVETLIPKSEEKAILPPSDLWDKKILDDSALWFLSPVPLHKAITDDEDHEAKGEMLTLSIESVEVYLESESTDNTRGHPVLALNMSAVFQVFEWTGNLSMSGDVQCEASYFNASMSLWEPLLEPLEFKDGVQRLWEIQLKMEKISPKPLQGSDVGDKPKFAFELAAVSPLQLTLTKTSLQLFKTLVDAYTKDYGKQVQGSVNVQALTGAPFTFVNKLGSGTVLFLKPGNSLKLKDRSEFSKLDHEQSVDLYLLKDIRKRSYASTILQKKSEMPTVDIAVGNKFRHIKSIPVETPGQFYYTLIPKMEVEESLSTYGLVIEVAVTGEKKTITARSSIQFSNQLSNDVDLLKVSSGEKDVSPSLITVIKPCETYAVPIHIASTGEYFIRPTDFGYEPKGPAISWRKKPEETDSMNFKCFLPGVDNAYHFIRVNRQAEVYKVRRNLPKEEFPHHFFTLHPPTVVHNLLPFDIFVEIPNSGNPSRCIEPGKHEHFHDLDLDNNPEIFVSVVQPHKSSLQGKFTLSKKPPPYINFPVAEESSSVELSVHTENDSYLKLGIFCPFWMVNKTDITLEYKEANKITKHPPGNSIVLLSTNNSKNKIQLGAITKNDTHSEWTKSFSLNAIGSSGNFSARLGEHMYKFGVEIRLSQFTLTKLVIVTPYFLLVNETKTNLQVFEEATPGNRSIVPPEEVVPFWPLSPGNKMVVVACSSDDGGACSVPFNYQQSDFTVLEFNKSSEVVALCLDVQESESATIVTFSPYYPGCVPVQLINHFPDMSLQFYQDTRSPLAITHTLQPRETLLYTWDDPSGRKVIKWNFPGAKVTNCKPIDVNKDTQEAFNLKFGSQASIASSLSSSLFKKGRNSKTSLTSIPPVKGMGDDWLEVDETFSEHLVSLPQEEEEEDLSSLAESEITTSASSSLLAERESPRTSIDSQSLSSRTSASNSSTSAYRGYWKSFIDGLQRVIVFTPDEGVVDRIRAENSYSVPLFEASLSLRSLGLSLVDNKKKRELAYIAITQSGIIWQIDKGKRIWKTVNTSLIEVLEEAYQAKKIDVKLKNLSVNLETMEMYSPIKGKLRRTHHDGVFVKFALSEKDYSVQAKIGYVQVDNQLPFSVYPQVLYPIPPPPTVASSTEPKPFVEASLILRKNEQSNGYHFKYVHVLVQKMAVNVDLGFILSLVDFFSLSGSDPLFQAEYLESDIEYVEKSLKETVVPELADDFSISRSFFDVLHLAPIKVTLSFNIRSVGKNKADNEITVGDRFLELFLHSIGVILTSVQETEMKFSCFHLEYQPQTGRGLTNLLVKHYRNQLLFQLHTLIFGLDVLGNPVSVVRGVVEGAVDLFYEPIKGSVLGPEEFFEGLGIGLRSFFGAGVVGGITGAGARITGAVGDVFAKLTFDSDFVDKRQQQRSQPPKLGRKFGNFAKNIFEGVTGVVTQPVKGLQKEGAVGLLKGTGRGLVGLLVRPTGGLVDLASGTLSFVTRKTQIGNFEISDIRPPRFIGRNGVIRPYSPHKAIGTALLVDVDEGSFVENDYYYGHIEISNKPFRFVLITDRRFMVIERRVLSEGWKSVNQAIFEFMSKPVEMKDVNVVVSYDPKYKDKRLNFLTLSSEDLAGEVAHVVNESYMAFLSEQ